jgi:hypothetical protein
MVRPRDFDSSSCRKVFPPRCEVCVGSAPKPTGFSRARRPKRGVSFRCRSPDPAKLVGELAHDPHHGAGAPHQPHRRLYRQPDRQVRATSPSPLIGGRGHPRGDADHHLESLACPDSGELPSGHRARIRPGCLMVVHERLHFRPHHLFNPAVFRPAVAPGCEPALTAMARPGWGPHRYTQLYA